MFMFSRGTGLVAALILIEDGVWICHRVVYTLFYHICSGIDLKPEVNPWGQTRHCNSCAKLCQVRNYALFCVCS